MLKKTTHKWLKEPDKWALANTLRDLEKQRKRDYKEKKRFPKYKAKKHIQSYRTTQSNNSIEIKSINGKNGRLKLPKLGWVKIRLSRIPEGRILNATVTRTKSGKYFISLCCEILPFQENKTNCSIGLDLGLKNFLTDSNGDKVVNPKFFEKHYRKIIRVQRKLERKQKDSKNWEKQRVKLAKAHEKLVNERKDFLQKLSTKIVNENDLICIEDLTVNFLKKNRRLSRVISQTGWRNFRTLLEYKSLLRNKKVSVVDKFFPSSQLCSNCGFKNKELKNLNIKEWVCPECGQKHDRDINAAKNILTEGKKQVPLGERELNASGGDGISNVANADF